MHRWPNDWTDVMDERVGRHLKELVSGELTGDEAQLVDAVLDFVSGEVCRIASRDDRESRYPAELVQGMRELGVFGLAIPREFGGLATRPSVGACVIGALASGWLSLPALLGSHLRVAGYIARFGTQEQKQRLLPPMAAGAVIAAHALTEVTGKDLGGLATRLRPSGHDGRIDGQKSYVTNAANADRIAIISRWDDGSDPDALQGPAGPRLGVALIEPTRSGVTVGADLPRLGVRGVSLNAVTLTQVPITIAVDCIGGGPVDASVVGEYTGIAASLSFAARAVGVGEAVIAACRRRLNEDRGGTSISDHQVVRTAFGRALTQQTASRAFMKQVLAKADRGELGPTEAAMSTAFSTTTSVENAHQAMLHAGGAGYTSSLPIERYLRDALSLETCGTPTDALLESVGSSALNR
jgi:alkylation response protein AidB-like acyl-CoA dehydrogenase